MTPLTARTGLVLNGERLLPVEFHHIGPLDQTQPSRPERHGAFDPHVSSQFIGLLIHTLVKHMALDGVDVFIKGLLQVDQGTLTRTTGVMFQG